MSLFAGANFSSNFKSSTLREDRILEALFSFRNDIIEEILKLKQLLISSVFQSKMFDSAQDNSHQQQLAVLLNEFLQNKMGDFISMSQPSDGNNELHNKSEKVVSSVIDNVVTSADSAIQEDGLVIESATSSIPSNLRESVSKLVPVEQAEINVKSEVSEFVHPDPKDTEHNDFDRRVLPVSLPAESESGQDPEADFIYWSEPNLDAQDFPTLDISGKQSLTCVECGKVFAYRSGLEKHFRIHTGVRPYKCKLCGKSFAQKGSLKYHIDIHTGQKRHKCSVCGKSFVHKGNLNYHVKTHHIGKAVLPSDSPTSSTNSFSVVARSGKSSVGTAHSQQF